MRLFLLLPLLVLAACDLAGTDGVDYGDPYRLTLQTEPTLVDDKLSVPVDYGGGCAAHTFSVRSRLDGGTAEVWLVHDANGDSCEALISETVTAGVPAEVAAAERVALLVPATTQADAEARVRLR